MSMDLTAKYDDFNIVLGGYDVQDKLKKEEEE